MTTGDLFTPFTERTANEYLTAHTRMERLTVYPPASRATDPESSHIAERSIGSAVYDGEGMMHTTDLFEAKLEALERIGLLPPASRTTDPESSHIAERSVTASGVRATQMARVLEAVQKWSGRSSAELAQLSGLDRYMVARRCSDLEHVGAVRKGPLTKCTVSNKLAVLWYPSK